MSYEPETQRAAKIFLNERRALLRAMEIDHDRGISANEIARMASGAVGRQLILEHLSARALLRTGQEILRTAALDGVFGFTYAGPFAQSARHVLLTLAVDPVEVEREPRALTDSLVRSLAEKDIRPVVADLDELRRLLWDGEEVRVKQLA